jgi:tetratricopeptide (TPR) repeat protein
MDEHTVFPRLLPATLFILLLAPAVLSAQTGTVFVTTEPIEAFCFFENELLDEKTPLILDSLPPGEYLLTLRKDGYRPSRVSVTVNSGEVDVVDIPLEPEVFMPSFPENEKVVFNETEIFKEGSLFKLPDGTYSIRQENDTIRFDPVYPNQGILNALHLSIPVMSAVSALLTINDFTVDAGSLTFFSPVTISSYIITASLIGFDLALSAEKKKFLNTFPITPVELEQTAYIARDDYEKAETLLTQDELTEALRLYMKVIENHKDSLYYPRSLYKVARIHNILGNNTLAKSELKLLKNKYPLPELYDKTCKNLADIYFSEKEFEKSIEQLDDMVFIDPFYDRETILLYRGEILEQWYLENPVKGDDLIAAYRRLLDDYPSSSNKNLYKARLAFYLMLEGRGDEARRQFENIEDPDEDVKAEIEYLLEILEERGLLE